MRLIDADALSDLLVETYEKAPTEKALLFVALLLKNNEQVPTIEYTFEEAFQKMVCEQKLYCPKRPQGETNAEIFKQTFGIYATELWSMSERDFLEWLNMEVQNDK